MTTNVRIVHHAFCIVAALVAAFAATTANAAGEPPFDKDIVTNYWLRLSAPEAKGAKVNPFIVHTMSEERKLEATAIGEDGLSGWIKMPRYRKGGKRNALWYQSCVLNFWNGKERMSAPMSLGCEIVDAPDGNIVATLPAKPVEGGAATILFDSVPVDAPIKAEWFADHLDALEKALDDAGYGELAMPRGIRMDVAMMTYSRFEDRSTLTFDPRLEAQIARLIRRLGGTSASSIGPFCSRKEGIGATAYSFITDSRLWCPIDEGWGERSKSRWRGFAKGWAKNSEKRLDVISIADESNYIYNYTNSPAFRATFERLRARLAPEVPSNAVPELIVRAALKNRPETREGRLIRYLTVRARIDETVKVFKRTTDDIKEALGPNAKTKVNLIPWYNGEGSVYRQTLFFTPDPLLLARHGAVDYPELQSLTPYGQPMGPMANVMLEPEFVAQARELNTRPGGGAIQMLFPCRCEARSYEHAFMSAFLNGNTDFSLYVLGFQGTWWEYADVPDKFLAVARCNRMLEKSAPYLLGQRRVKADIAMLLSECQDIWQTSGMSASDAEMRGSFYALRFSGHRVDFVREHMVEDGLLGDYKVLWATMRDLNRVSQGIVLDWVKAGGTLVLTPGALSRDEADDPSAIFDEWRADGAAAAVPAKDVAEFDYRKGDTSAPVRETVVGKGKIVSFAWMPGMNFCSGSLKRREKYRDETPNGNPNHEIQDGVQRYGVAFWMEGDDAVREKIAAVAEAAGATRQIKLSHSNIDAGVLDDGLRAFVGFSNYNVGQTKGLVAEFRLKKRYDSIKTLDGAPVKVEWDGTTARCAFDLGDSQALLFE